MATPERPRLSYLLGAALALCAGSLGHASPAATPVPPIHVLTDIHYLAESLHDEGDAFRRMVLEGDGKNTELIPGILEAYRFALAGEEPPIILVTGDLTLNGEKASHLELASVFKRLESLGARVFVTPGNHDILNPWARGFAGSRAYLVDGVSPEEFRAIYRDHGFGEALARDAESLCYVVEPVPGLRIFMLDSSIHAENTRRGYPEAGGGFGAGTLEWIKRNLAEARRAGSRVLVAMHHGAVSHAAYARGAYSVRDPDAFLDLLLASGVDLAFTGHIHVQDIGARTRPRGTFHDIATNALSVFPHQYGRVTLDTGKGTLTYGSVRVDVESWAREEGVDDARLTGFRTYSESFFRERSASMVERMLAEEGIRPGRQRTMALIALLGTLNARLFAGLSSLNASDTVHSEAFRDLVAADYGFLSRYARAIVEDPTPENNRLSVPF